MKIRMENCLFRLLDLIPRGIRVRLAHTPIVSIYRWLMRMLGHVDGDGLRVIEGGPLRGRKLFIGSSDERGFISIREYLQGTYEPLVAEAIIRYCVAGSTAIDIGAHYGYFSLLMAQNVGKQGRCIAIEANGENYSKIVETIRANPDVNLSVEHKAVSDKNGQAAFSKHQNSLMGHMVESGGDTDKLAIELVETCTLDSYIHLAQVSHISVIKIDVEGAELMVLEGSVETIIQYQPVLLIEVHKFPNSETMAKALLSKLITWQYRVVYIGTEQVVDHESFSGGFVMAIPISG